MQKYKLIKLFSIVCLIVLFLCESTACYQTIKVQSGGASEAVRETNDEIENKEVLSQDLDIKNETEKTPDKMRLLLGLSDINLNLSTYLIDNTNSDFIIQKTEGLLSKYDSQYITTYPNSEQFVVYNNNGVLQNPQQNTITSILHNLENQSIQTEEYTEVVTTPKNTYPFSGAMQITYMHNNIFSWNQCYLELDVFYDCPTILSFFSGTTYLLTDKLLKVCYYSEIDGFRDGDGNVVIIYDNINADSLKSFPKMKLPENTLLEKDFPSYQYYQNYYRNFSFPKIDFDKYNGISLIVRYSTFPNTAVEPEFIDLAVIHEKGKWISYACLNHGMDFMDLYNDENDPEFIDAVSYPYMVALPDEVTDELIDNFTVPAKSFEEVQTLLPEAEDFFTNTEDDMMGIICNDTLFLYSSSSEIEPLEKIKVGKDSRIVMLEWLTEEEYQEWDEYFKAKEEVEKLSKSIN